MLHLILYSLHILAVVMLLLLGLDLQFNGKLAKANKKRVASILASISHSQILIGIALFLFALHEINLYKIGIKIILAIISAILFTMYTKKIKKEQIPSRIVLPAGIILIIAISLITIIWK